MAGEDRVDAFVQWIRSHKYLSMVVIIAVVITATAKTVGGVEDIVNSSKRVMAWLFSATDSPPATVPSPVTVDLTYGLAKERGSIAFVADVINTSKEPVYLKCVGLHLDLGGLYSHFWLEPQELTNPLSAGGKATFDKVLSTMDFTASPDHGDIWISVQSNADTIFEGSSLEDKIDELVAVSVRVMDMKNVIVPSTMTRLENTPSGQDFRAACSQQEPPRRAK